MMGFPVRVIVTSEIALRWMTFLTARGAADRTAIGRGAILAAVWIAEEWRPSQLALQWLAVSSSTCGNSDA